MRLSKEEIKMFNKYSLDYSKPKRGNFPNKPLIVAAAVLIVAISGLLVYLYVSDSERIGSGPGSTNETADFPLSVKLGDPSVQVRYPRGWEADIADPSENESAGVNQLTLTNESTSSAIRIISFAQSKGTVTEVDDETKDLIISLSKERVEEEARALPDATIQEANTTRLKNLSTKKGAWLEQKVNYILDDTARVKYYLSPLTNDPYNLDIVADYNEKDSETVMNIIKGIQKSEK